MGNDSQKPQASATPKTAPKTAKTHLVARARKGKFRRAGLAFDKVYKVIEIADIGAERAKAILTEPMLDAYEVTAEEAKGFDAVSLVDDEGATKAELIQRLSVERKRADDAEALVAELRSKLSGADFAPPAGKMPNGDPIGR